MPRPPQVHLTEYPTQAGIRYKLRWHSGGRDNEEGGFEHKDRAEVRQAEILTQLRRQQTPLSSAGNQRLCDFAEYHFLTSKRLKPGTVKRYQGLVKLNMNQALAYRDASGHKKTICLGQLALKRITIDLVEEWVEAVEQIRGPMERAKAYRCLSSIMTRALRLGEITSHPCKVDGASVELEKKRPLPDDDVPWRMAQALRDYTDKYGRHSRDRYAAIPLFIGYGTGNRKSEVRGLRRRDICLDEGRIEIERQAYFIDGKGWDTEAPTKSKKGNRIIFVYEAALDALRQHVATYMRPAEEDPLGNDLVFAGPTGGPISDSSWDLAWRQARIDAGVNADLRLHDLRHLAATSVAEDTKDLKHIQEYLGDSTVVAAMRYLSVTDESKKKIGRAMGQRFRRYAPADTDNVVPLRQAN